MRDIKTIVNEMQAAHGINLNFNKFCFKIPEAEANFRQAFDYFVNGFDFVPEYNEIVEWMSDNNGMGLVLSGDPGRGKSIILTKIIPFLFYEYLKKVVRVAIGDDVNAIYRELIKNSIIGIDEIGCEDVLNDYGNKHMALHSILDAVEKRGKLLILTTNLSPEQILKKYGVRCFERLTAVCRIVKFNGESFRNKP